MPPIPDPRVRPRTGLERVNVDFKLTGIKNATDAHIQGAIMKAAMDSIKATAGSNVAHFSLSGHIQTGAQ
jgi:hypothetical protein